MFVYCRCVSGACVIVCACMCGVHFWGHCVCVPVCGGFCLCVCVLLVSNVRVFANYMFANFAVLRFAEFCSLFNSRCCRDIGLSVHVATSTYSYSPFFGHTLTFLEMPHY